MQTICNRQEVSHKCCATDYLSDFRRNDCDGDLRFVIVALLLCIFILAFDGAAVMKVTQVLVCRVTDAYYEVSSCDCAIM